MLSGYSTTIDEDEKLLSQKSMIDNNSRLYNAIILRYSEKTILRSNLLLLEAHKLMITLRYKSTIPDISSSLILGCSSLAGLYASIGDEIPMKIIDVAINENIYMYDTAPHYGLGLSEERLGRGLSLININKDIKVYTKVGRLILNENEIIDTSRIEHENTPGNPSCIFPETPINRIPVRNYTYEGIMKSYEDSLQRLGLNIFGLRIHDCEDELSLEEVMNRGGLEALIELKASKRISEVSLGLNKATIALRILIEAKSKMLKIDSVMIAGSYNLLDHDIDCIRLFHYCQQEGIEIHNAGIYASGILASGKYYKYSVASNEQVEKVRLWQELCDEYKFSLRAVCLTFSMLPEVVTKIAIGVKSSEEVLELVQDYQQMQKIKDSDIFKVAKKRLLLASYI